MFDLTHGSLQEAVDNLRKGHKFILCLSLKYMIYYNHISFKLSNIDCLKNVFSQGGFLKCSILYHVLGVYCRCCLMWYVFWLTVGFSTFENKDKMFSILSNSNDVQEIFFSCGIISHQCYFNNEMTTFSYSFFNGRTEAKQTLPYQRKDLSFPASHCFWAAAENMALIWWKQEFLHSFLSASRQCKWAALASRCLFNTFHLSNILPLTTLSPINPLPPLLTVHI